MDNFLSLKQLTQTQLHDLLQLAQMIKLRLLNITKL